MTTTAFNPCTCSNQDWATRLATVDASLFHYVADRAKKQEHWERFAENLHTAMGYRADQPEY